MPAKLGRGGKSGAKNPRKILERDGTKIILNFPGLGEVNPHGALPLDTELSLESSAPGLGEERGLGNPISLRNFASGMSPGRSGALLFANPCLEIPRDSAPEGVGLTRRIQDVIPFIPGKGFRTRKRMGKNQD